MSHSLLIQRKTHRLARDTLRRILWSVWIWAKQTNPEPFVSRFQSVVEGLPRHLLEHEKAFILILVQAFGFETPYSETRSLTDSTSSNSFSNSSGMGEIFLKFYIRSFSAMKRFFCWNPKAMGIFSSSSTNLFLTASACLVPVEEIDRVFARVFSVSEPEGMSPRILFVAVTLCSNLQTSFFSHKRPERRVKHLPTNGT